MARKKVIVEEPVVAERSEKDVLLELHAELRRRGITRISDLESQIAQAE